MLCDLLLRSSNCEVSRPVRTSWRQFGQVAVVLAVALGAAGPASASALNKAPAAPAEPLPMADDEETGSHWCERLLAIIDLLCAVLGCSPAQVVDNGSLSDAITRLSVTVSGGLPALSDKDRAAAVSAALEAAVIAEDHASALGTNHAVLADTLDVIVGQLAGGRSK